jgi:hypothetical protein
MQTEKNIALATDVLDRVRAQADAEGKTPDELANELLGSLVELRTQSDAGDRRWQDLLDYGHGQAAKLGIREADVERLIHEWRSEQRGR